MQYQTGNASIFATAARSTPVRFVTHFDHPNQRWNVFKKVEGREEYVTFFISHADAQEYCELKNEADNDQR